MVFTNQQETTVFPTVHSNGQITEPRRLRGLRFPVLPKASWLVQVSGGIAALSGVWMQWGTAIALIAGGVATVVVSMLDESGMLKEDDKGKG
jgi:hypothetical protein